MNNKNIETYTEEAWKKPMTKYNEYFQLYGVPQYIRLVDMQKLIFTYPDFGSLFSKPDRKVLDPNGPYISLIQTKIMSAYR